MDKSNGHVADDRSMTDATFGLERRFDPSFVAALALREKQVQQSYRPVISIHKWFARRPGSVFRSLMLSEYIELPLRQSYWQSHDVRGIIADPFMGGGTSVYEALRLGLSAVGADVNPMSYWLVREAVEPIELEQFVKHAEQVWLRLRERLGHLWQTACTRCGEQAEGKYYLWVKTCDCPMCAADVELFAGYRVAEAVRHTHEVYYCPTCERLVELPKGNDRRCPTCTTDLSRGNVRRKKATCRACDAVFEFGDQLASPPNHKLFGIEYNCAACYDSHRGRQFKTPDDHDHGLVEEANILLTSARSDIPDEKIEPGDETDRLLRWGYSRFSELFNPRQLVALAALMDEIRAVDDDRIRRALETVFSDFLRYQNLLCRYDTYALKCQDIFSVHGFPVGLVACENNVPGIQSIGSGSWIHFVAKYEKAKTYTKKPFERSLDKKKKAIISLDESIETDLADRPRAASPQYAFLSCQPSQSLPLPPESLDGVFTDPPYFANVQYAELMDFCYVWLKKLTSNQVPEFAAPSTRSVDELTGNITMQRGMEHFTEGISEVFAAMAIALKAGAPLAFTYHHNDSMAYAPLVVAILEAGLTCTAVLPAPAEMSASIHIAGTKSSIIDSIFVCRHRTFVAESNWQPLNTTLTQRVEKDERAMADAGYACTAGDLQCLTAGHAAAEAVRLLADDWQAAGSINHKLEIVRDTILRALHDSE